MESKTPYGLRAAGHNIGEVLLREGLITNAQLDAALDVQRKTDQPLVRILVEHGMLEEKKRLNFFKRQFQIPIVSLENVTIDPLLFTYVPGNLARKHHLVPVKLDRDGLVVAMEDPSDLLVQDNLKEIAGVRIKPVVAASAEIIEALRGYPEEKQPQQADVRPNKFDWVTRFLKIAFLPIMSLGALLTIILLVGYNTAVREWYENLIPSNSIHKTSQYWTLFLYFFLSWGVWTIVMYEINGLIFEDMEWRDADDVGEPKVKRKATMLAVLLGWLGFDRFYLGYKRMGIAKFLTLGLFGLWWIMDIFAIGGGKVPDAAGRPIT